MPEHCFLPRIVFPLYALRAYKKEYIVMLVRRNCKEIFLPQARRQLNTKAHSLDIEKNSSRLSIYPCRHSRRRGYCV